ncbi:hypothetical protein BJV82DRAFT_598336 [Fennellomyces sp. T-0311]|nr:hypothetical protein BJV82DRAFT_598336 [Fennellomyces sp. T-0311]
MIGNVLTDQSRQHGGFMDALPLDILPLIFSYLSQRDCVRCMSVCRGWYSLVPLYSKRVWKKLIVSPAYIRRGDHARWEQCLGRHVKSITFNQFHDETELYRMMQKLIDCGCLHAEHVALARCSTVTQTTFINMLRQFGSQLTHMSLRSHLSNISFLHVMNACPKLTHFMFWADLLRTDHCIYNKEPPVHGPLPLYFPTITFLYLDAIIDQQQRLEPILRMCPNLRCFIGARSNIMQLRGTGVSYNAIAVPLDSLFDWCPKVVYLESTCFCYVPKKVGQIEAFRGHGLKYFGVCDGYGRDQVLRHLLKNQHTLEHLAFRKYNPFHGNDDWSGVLQSLQLAQLRTLHFDDKIRFSASSLVAVLNECPVLQELVVKSTPLMFDRAIIRPLRRMLHLHTLKSQSIAFDDEMTTIAMLERLPALETINLKAPSLELNFSKITQRLKHLKHLGLVYVRLKYDGEPHESKLETIQLLNAPYITQQLLLAIASIPTLKRLHVNFYQRSHEEEDVLYLFANKTQNNSIESLKLRGVRRLSFAALSAFGDFSRLTELEMLEPFDDQLITAPIQVDQLGLLQMLRKSTSLELLFFRKMVLVDGDQVVTSDQLVRLMKRELSDYTFVADLGTERLSDWERARIMYNLSIRRLSPAR